MLVSTRVHPLAALFPLLEGEEFDKLCADIKASGLVNPIVMHKGLLLDGRNRLRACHKIGIKIATVQFEDLGLSCTPEEYIWSVNMTRRHLDDDQRAAISMEWRQDTRAPNMAKRLQNLKKGQQKPERVENARSGNSSHPTRTKLAQTSQTSQYKIKQAEQIADQPELLKKVRLGKLPLAEAVKRAARKIAKRQPRSASTRNGNAKVKESSDRTIRDIYKSVAQSIRLSCDSTPMEIAVQLDEWMGGIALAKVSHAVDALFKSRAISI